MTKNRKITVAFFLPSLEPGGTERNVVNLVNNIDKKTYEVSLVLGVSQGDFIQEINSTISITSLGTSRSVATFFSLIAYFKKHQPDIFVSAFPRINVICIIAKVFSKTKTKIVITEHSVFSLLPVIAKSFWRGVFARFVMPSLCSWVYPKADAIICVSKGIASDILKTVNRNLKLDLIYNPVITDRIYQLAQEPVMHPWFSDSLDVVSSDSAQGGRAKLKIPVIIAVGRLVACKDYPTLFKAFNLVLKKQPARLVILGRGPQKEILMQLTDRIGLSPNIDFLGFQDNPYKYMKKASVFVLSSLQEGFGNVIVEAMACGTAVVATNCKSGPAEIIQPGVNGLLVPLQDEKALAEAILKVLNNPELAEKFSEEGKKRAEFFSVEKSVSEYEKIFNKLTGI